MPDGHSLDVTRYFTARVRKAGSQDRQNTFLEALEQHRPPPVLQIKYGFVKFEPRECLHCGRSWQEQQEKQTDVNLAVALAEDARDDLFDVAVIVSGDADLRAGVEAAQHQGKEVWAAFPPAREGKELAEICDGSEMISKSRIKRHQLPNPVTKNDGYELWMPVEWTQPPEDKPQQ